MHSIEAIQRKMQAKSFGRSWLKFVSIYRQTYVSWDAELLYYHLQFKTQTTQ
jgi:hypothetical protein